MFNPLQTAVDPGALRRRGHGRPFPRRRAMPSWMLRALHAEWRKVSPGVSLDSSSAGESDPERAARLAFCSGLLKTPVESFKSLSFSQGRRLLFGLREISGAGPEYRTRLICIAASDLFGADWHEELQGRISSRFTISAIADLTPAQGHELIEELISRIARRDGTNIEAVRACVRERARAFESPKGA